MCKHSHILAMSENTWISSTGQHDNLDDKTYSHVCQPTTADAHGALDALSEDDAKRCHVSKLMPNPVPNPPSNPSPDPPPAFEPYVKKFEIIAKFMSSTQISNEAKTTLIQKLRTLPLDMIEVKNNPDMFPKIVRKRNHDPQSRSFFRHQKKRSLKEKPNFWYRP
ncbi:hypothetical protein TCAL_12785 [Tigriopus californicus]|uniref:Uncharacterized protein n=1 Tax=Tigriopus californicus TaxID=6832 RepID=A0A553N6U1_TIGCA|nr:hypothetical protein TCAL_12785 [Tigriopus californicus]